MPRLMLAYRSGIFPWYAEEDPILWYSPDPRMVLYPSDLKISKSMRPVLNQQRFRITFDTAFAEVLHACASTPRPGQDGTWLTIEMQEAYKALHRKGYAHSIEAWQEDRLVGGLYGVSIGKCFFGESMFASEPNASKAAFIALVQLLHKAEFAFIDCQVYTDHLASLGASEIPRTTFLAELKQAITFPSITGKWTSRKILSHSWA